MDKYIELDSTSLDASKQHCVFASIFCKNGTPYYKKVDKKDIRMSIAFMQMRWDGSIGFPGGKVSKEEIIENNGIVDVNLLKNTLIRELKEEINIEDNFIKKNYLKHLTTFIDGNYVIHNFSYEITYEEMIKLYQRASLCTAIGGENSGNILVHIYEYNKYKGLKNFFKNKFCASTKFELLELINNENLLFIQNTDYHIEENIRFIKKKVNIKEPVIIDSIQKMQYEFTD